MDSVAQPLTMTFHRLGGAKEQYIQDEAAISNRILAAIDPQKFFGQTSISVETKSSLIILPPTQIARIDFDGAGVDSALRFNVPQELREISHDEFNEKFKPGHDRAQSRSSKSKPGEEFHGFARMILAGGEEVFTETKAILTTSLDQGLRIAQLFHQKAIVIRNCSGGVSLINVSHILRLELLPGQPNLAPAAWHAEPVANSFVHEL